MGDSRIWKSTAVLASIFALSVVVVILFDATNGISRFLFYQVDIPGFVTAGLILIVSAALVFVMPRSVWTRLSNFQIWAAKAWLLGAASLVLAVIGTHAVYHGYAFSIDEWMTRLQGEIFSTGQLSAVVPEEWREYGRAMYHVFAAYDEGTGRLASDYRPGMAVLTAALDTLGLGLYTAALLNALSIPLIAVVSLRLWPDRRDIAAMSALLLFSSQQALAAAMTSYAMTAHLFFNLLWLSLFLRGDWKGHILAVLVGGIAITLHQIHVHIFFVAPFMLMLLRPFRPGVIALYALGYLAALALAYSWDWYSVNRYLTVNTGDARTLLERLRRLAEVPTAQDLMTVYVNVARLLVWQNLALFVMLSGAGLSLFQDKWLRVLGASVLLSLLPYPFLMPDQGHGWGYRYLHGLIGPLALVGAFGWTKLLSQSSVSRGIAFLNLLVLASIFVMIPLRAVQIRDMVAPYAQATEIVSSIDADVVIVDTRRIFIGQDIARNSPVALLRPIQMFLHKLTPEQIAQLCHDHRVVYWGPDQMPDDLGLLIYPAEVFVDDPVYSDQIAVLDTPACNRD